MKPNVAGICVWICAATFARSMMQERASAGSVSQLSAKGAGEVSGVSADPAPTVASRFTSDKCGWAELGCDVQVGSAASLPPLLLLLLPRK